MPIDAPVQEGEQASRYDAQRLAGSRARERIDSNDLDHPFQKPA
ncbi:hypothetical protein ASZ90_009247 [hydrocarbon metagenome]|uniref:Uncharacterized protein n=1 Tax=hydrocarbon metagenome TaxID=938273 RepID=A0A0W8FJA9_9ZZZZ